MNTTAPNWPQLDFDKIQPTLETLHQWLQIVGKIRLRTMPWQNHSWHSTLYISSKGYTTGDIPYEGHLFRIDFDFQEHELKLECVGQQPQIIPLVPMTVADFYQKIFEKLHHLGIKVRIHGRPNEMEPAIPFAENVANRHYDRDAAKNLWMAFLRSNEVFQRFRSGFIGKCSPVHLFWGAFDLAVTRFSGKPAPLHQGGMPNMPLDVMQEAYSHEVSSAGFWPGSKDYPTPFFYSYAYPVAEDFRTQPIQPDKAFYSEQLGEFIFKYSDVATAKNPEASLLAFLESTYEAAAATANWNRDLLERK